jgi:hypothetical protein
MGATDGQATWNRAGTAQAIRAIDARLVGMEDDAYAPLRPPPGTPLDELCDCPVGAPIMLMTALSWNPIHWLRCNREVDAGGAGV